MELLTSLENTTWNVRGISRLSKGYAKVANVVVNFRQHLELLEIYQMLKIAIFAPLGRVGICK